MCMNLSYHSNTKDLVEDKNILPDKFYEVGMYEMNEYNIAHSISISDSICMDSLFKNKFY